MVLEGCSRRSPKKGINIYSSRESTIRMPTKFTTEPSEGEEEPPRTSRLSNIAYM